MKSRLLHFSVLLAVLLTLVTPLSAFAESSNRNEVRKTLAKGGWSVVYGDLINEWDYFEFTAAVASAVACECPTPVFRYFNAQLNAQIEKVQRTAPNIAYDALVDMIIRSFSGKGTVMRQGKLEIGAGLATYNRWEAVSYKEPRSTKCKAKLPFGGWTWVPCTTMVTVYKQVPLPNNFQPYVRFRFVDK